MRNIGIIMSICCPLTLFGQIDLIMTNTATNVGITGSVDNVYINEFHYDNASADLGEFVEVAGPAGTNLSSYTITLYNGGDNSKYHTLTLSGTIDNEGSGVGAVSFLLSGIQNGSPDGIALSKSGSTKVQFLSYEGTITAVDGDSNGVLSVDIGIDESSSTPAGYSLEYNEGSTAWVVVSNDSPGDFAQGTLLSTNKIVKNSYNIYPNPAWDEFLNISSVNNAAMKIVVYDLSGKQVIHKIINNERLDISILNTGIYIMKVSQDRMWTTKKIIIN